jgi:hypothetical protein
MKCKTCKAQTRKPGLCRECCAKESERRKAYRRGLRRHKTVDNSHAPACWGHDFGPKLRCDCGVSWHQHQQQPVACALLEPEGDTA